MFGAFLLIPGNPGLIFHDSCTSKTAQGSIHQIHTIKWYGTANKAEQPPLAGLLGEIPNSSRPFFAYMQRAGQMTNISTNQCMRFLLLQYRPTQWKQPHRVSRT